VSIASILGGVADVLGVYGAIKGAGTLARPTPQQPFGTRPGLLTPRTTLPALPGPGKGYGFTTGGTLSQARGMVPSATGMVPRGYHYAKDGSGRVVRNRRMNPTNPRALRRAIRRIKSFRRIAHQIERQLPTRTVHRRK
jgi:hypothetical protein